ncbi:phosphoadenosine phosphosulfate reductase family protein [Rheinheimera hassiensis]|uniref:phosphoadenosine phosphosulfate reductase family protein n=1 Tax=Rheinheimera hassiensis TaxID=1193627 RepID=UPI001F05C1F4|nr:phosphoadenosine phosphosulfate reductase family protein [Rheinheimera hassiensis]
MPAIIDASNNIDITLIDNLLLQDNAALKTVAEKFHGGVSELKTLVRDGNAILFCPTSMGKDSTIVTLMALEAYKQLIAEGSIPATHPLIMSTVDTGGEAIPMKMYVSYARKRVLAYAQSHGINLIYDIVRPPVNDEYFVKFVGGQKLIPNATRHGDCSVILKVDPSARYVKNLLKRLQEKNPSGTFKVITCVGSRTEESQRRSTNMKKQGIAVKSADDLLNELQVESVGNHTLYKFAPIKDWETSQVFDALRLAGTRPLTKVPGISIPGFLADFGLLLEIYGNGSNETCDIAVGSKASSGCNGKARFGCVYCTMVAAKDHSSTALAALPRWRVLGAENALRMRDYLFRLSVDVDARALHARAHDPVGFNRAALQPNTMKPKYLEKMVRYASQLSLDSLKGASEFKALVAQGREMEHEGYSDIANDPNMPPRTKKAFLEMYKECAQVPQLELFSERHAVLLSFRWSIDGIGAAPYRPLAIWKQLESGKGWIPYPQLNSEYELKHGPVTLQSTKSLPEAVMMPIFKIEDPKQHALTPVPLLSLWSRPNDASDVFEEDHNCSVERQANHLADLQVTFEHRFEIIPLESAQYGFGNTIYYISEAGAHAVRVKYLGSNINTIKIDGKAISAPVADKLLDSGLKSEIEDHFYDMSEALCEKINSLAMTGKAAISSAEITAELAKKLGGTVTLKRKVKYLKRTFVHAGYRSVGKRIEPAHKFTRRVTKVVKGQLAKGNTRMTFYPHVVDSAMHQSHNVEASFLMPDFATHTMKFIGSHDNSITGNTDTLENILVDNRALALWKEFGGLDRALQVHDDHFSGIINKRHIRKSGRFSVRQYGGTHVAEHLLAEGVVSIDKAYWGQLRAILRRSHIFNELGLFSFQSMSPEQVAMHPRAVSMQQHRSDKARVLNVIRRHRNKQRQAIKATKGKFNLTDALSSFEHAANAAVSAMTHELNSHLLKLRFDTHEVSPTTRASTSSLWLSLYFTDIYHIDDVIGHLIPASLVRELKRAPLQYMKVSRSVLRLLTELKEKIDCALTEWAPVSMALSQVIGGHDGYQQKLSDVVKNTIITNAPLTDNDVLMQFWNPSDEAVLSQLAATLKAISEYSAQLTIVRDQLTILVKQSLRQVTKGMSLRDKLSLLTQQAA